MMATGPFAVPTFRGLYDSSHEVAALATAPLRSHRGKELPAASPLRDVARAAPHAHPRTGRRQRGRGQARLAAYRGRPAGRLRLRTDSGRRTLAAARLGGINLHASLLPKYRGAAPIQWAIYHGETETGVTVIHMTPQNRRRAVHCPGPHRHRPDETAGELEPRLAELGLAGAPGDRRSRGRAHGGPAPGRGLGLDGPAIEEDRRPDRLEPARPRRSKNQIRAMEPWPRTYTFWHRPARPAAAADPRPGAAVRRRQPPAQPCRPARSWRPPADGCDCRRAGSGALPRTPAGGQTAAGNRGISAGISRSAGGSPCAQELPSPPGPMC